MSKNLHEPSTPRAVAANRYSGKLTQQKPYAYEWVIPVNTADCAAAQVDTPWIPCYLNTWEQPTTLEPLAVRVNADGRLQWKGYANSQNATSAIAFIMPGTLGGEPDMIPPDDPGNLSYNVFVTPDDGSSIQKARAYVDSTTGEVTIIPDTNVESCVMRSWNYDTDNTVPDTTWTDVTAGAFGKGYYEEAWLSNPVAPGLGYDFDTGVISSSFAAHFIVQGWVQFWEDANVGESRAVAILLIDDGQRFLSEFTATTVTGVVDHRLTVSSGFLTAAGGFDVSLQVWHDHGSDLTIRDAEIYATKLELAGGEFFARP